MIHSPKVRMAARLTLAVASVLVIAGGILIYQGTAQLGDGFMIVGLVMFCIGAGVLAATPTGDKDAR